MFNQTFLSSQVKRCAIFTDKHDMYELPHELPHGMYELPNALRLRIRKVPKPYRMIDQSPCQIKNLVNTSKTLLKNRN